MSTIVILAFVFGLTGTSIGLVALTQVLALKKEIARLKKELQTLRKIMRNYVVQIDSLNRANEQLKVEKNEAVKKYKQASSTATTLKKEKEKHYLMKKHLEKNYLIFIQHVFF